MLAWSWIQHVIAGIMMLHLFVVMNASNPSLLDYLYGVFIFSHIFSLTSLLDFKKYSILVELFKMILGLVLLYIQDNTWYDLDGIIILPIIVYLMISMALNLFFLFERKDPISA